LKKTRLLGLVGENANDEPDKATSQRFKDERFTVASATRRDAQTEIRACRSWTCSNVQFAVRNSFFFSGKFVGYLANLVTISFKVDWQLESLGFDVSSPL